MVDAYADLAYLQGRFDALMDAATVFEKTGTSGVLTAKRLREMATEEAQGKKVAA